MSNNIDRYQKFRTLAVTNVDVLSKGNIVIYHVYCLGRHSFISSEYIKDFKLIHDGEFVSFETQCLDRLDLKHDHYLNDCGMGEYNYNQHLIFIDKSVAEKYVEACRSDLDEVERYSRYVALCDEFDGNDYGYNECGNLGQCPR